MMMHSIYNHMLAPHKSVNKDLYYIQYIDAAALMKTMCFNLTGSNFLRQILLIYKLTINNSYKSQISFPFLLIFFFTPLDKY